MEDEKIILECDCYQPGVGVAIVCSNTGIVCTVQAGGQCCDHPMVQGFPIILHTADNELFYKELDAFNDCSFGCSILHTDEITDEYRKNYANNIKDFLDKNLNGLFTNLGLIRFQFDYDNIKELTEGWWPVLIEFRNTEWQQGMYQEKWYNTKFKGYLHFGNCD